MAPQLDAHIASIIDKRNASEVSEHEDDDSFLDSLEDDPDFESFRERRMEAMQKEWKRQNHFRGAGHGSYTEIKDEKQLMDITTSTKLCVVHFWKPDFNRCRIMDAHLENLASLHTDTRFLKINVANASFLVSKLRVQVLPCVHVFIDGVGVDKIVGFEGLGGETDRFHTRDLEKRLLHAEALARPVLLTDISLSVHKGAKVAYSAGHATDADAGDDDDDDDDWE